MKGEGKVGGDHDMDQHIREVLDNGLQSLDGKIKAILNSKRGAKHRREHMTDPMTEAGEPKAGSLAGAAALASLLKFRLQKYGESKAEQILLATLLGCNSSSSCSSPACPNCTYTVQGVMNELHKDIREGGVLLDGCVTIVPPRIRFMPSTAPDRGVDAAGESITKFRRRLDEAFEAAGVSNVIGAIDLGYNEFPEDRFTEHCRPHLHGLAFASPLTAGDRQLRKAFPKKGSVSRPVQVEPFDGEDGWLRYALKTPNSRTIRKKDEAGLWLPSTYKPLTVEQHLQQALVLHEIGWAGKLYLRGFDLVEGRHGWRLTLTTFQPAVIEKKRGT